MSTISDRVFYSQHIVECRWFHEASNDRTLEMSDMCKGYQTHKTVPGVRSTASCSNISAFADVGFNVSPNAFTVPMFPCKPDKPASRRGLATTQYFAPTMAVTTVPNPSSSIWGHETACFKAAVPQHVSSVLGFTGGNPRIPRVSCMPRSWVVKCLQIHLLILQFQPIPRPHTYTGGVWPQKCLPLANPEC